MNRECSKQDREILKKLGTRYMEIALLPVQREKMEMWKALNRGEMQRPMVTIDQLPWNELNQDGELDCRCEDTFFRGIERELRQIIYKWEHFPVDMVVEPFVIIPKSLHNTWYGIKADEDILATDMKNSVVAHSYSNQIQCEEDIVKIKDMIITHNQKESGLWMEQAAWIFQGIAPVRQSGGIQFYLAVWDELSTYMGVENIYLDLIDRPDFIHAVMERITSSTVAGIEQANELRVHNDIINTCHCTHTYTDSLLPDFGKGKGSVSRNSWAFGMAQLFSSVSPATTNEFEIPYISRMAEYFGMIYYGCCDRLDDRLDMVKKIPNLKKVSCSPWSDRDAFAEKIGSDIVMSNKPSPSLVATDTLDSDTIRKDLEHTVSAAKRNNVNLELILKDISTVRYEPERLTKWAEIAMNVVEGL